MKNRTLQELAPDQRNPRRISDKQLEMLKKSLEEFGDLSGIVFNRKTGVLVGAHQRLKVLPKDAEIEITKEYKKPTRTGTVAEGYVIVDGERFTYREVNWNSTKAKAANLAANKHGGEFDLPMLNEFLLELDAENYDLDLTGFTAEEIENLMAPPNAKSTVSEHERERQGSKEFSEDEFSQFDHTCPKCGFGFDD